MLLSPQAPRPNDPVFLDEALCAGDIWVFQAPEIILNISVASRPDMNIPLSQFTSRLGEVVCNAKLWADLGLNILFRSCIHGLEWNDTGFQLSFRIRKRLVASKRRGARKLPDILKDLGDLLPPANTATACLSALNVSIVFDHYGHYYPLEIYTFPFAVPTSWPERHQEDTQDILLEIKSPSDSVQGMEYPGFNFACADEENNELILKEEPLACVEEEPFPGSLCGIPRCPELNALFCLGLRSLIGGDLLQEGKENRTVSNDFRCLSTIAPSVFNRQYRDAMNQRSRLILSISKSIMDMLRTSNKRLLHKKFALIKESHTQTLETPTSGSEAEDTLKTSLWRIAQRRLHKNQEPQELSPLHPFLDHHNKHQAPSDILLSEASTEPKTDISEDDEPVDNDSDWYLGTEDGSYECDGVEDIITSECSPTCAVEHDSTTHTKYASEMLNNLHHTSPHTSISIPLECFGATESDGEMLIHDVVEEGPLSQPHFSHQSPLIATEELNDADDDEASDDMLCDETSYILCC